MVHVLALAFMTLQRLVLLITNLQQIQNVEHTFSCIFSALIRGVWFDNVIACYITFFPLVAISVLGLFNISNKCVFRTFNILFSILYAIVFGVGIANIPYFNYFSKHLNSSIFNWAEEKGTAVNMILQERSYYVYFLFFFLSVVSFTFFVTKISRVLLRKNQQNIIGKTYFIYVPLCLLLLGSCVFGARGRTVYNPIKTSQAYFCNNTFLNHLGLNPLFFFIHDVIESRESHYNVDQIVSERAALVFTRKELGFTDSLYEKSPIARTVVAQGKPRKMNVLVVLMESMSANFLEIREKGREITPFLQELIGKSYYFNNFYSAGNHTNHGVMATLFGVPALFDRNVMKNVDIPLCSGLPNVLQADGYRTMFFMSHESQYDNMNAFLRENGVSEIYSQENYPVGKRVNSFGVPDDYLLSYAFDKINLESADNKPFQATVLTISNHPPYIVPERFKAVSSEPQYQIVAYADDAIRQFMAKAAKQKWYNNTMFVFLGDHGKNVGANSYELPLSYNHIPLIIYSPAFKDAPRKLEQLGGQIDVFPTLMGLLNRSYVNNTLGVDLFKTIRQSMFFSADDGLGCINKDYFYAYNFKSKTEGLYKYRNNSPENLAAQNRAKCDSMKLESAAMFQTAQYMIRKQILRIK